MANGNGYGKQLIRIKNMVIDKIPNKEEDPRKSSGNMPMAAKLGMDI